MNRQYNRVVKSSDQIIRIAMNECLLLRPFLLDDCRFTTIHLPCDDKFRLHLYGSHSILVDDNRNKAKKSSSHQSRCTTQEEEFFNSCCRDVSAKDKLGKGKTSDSKY